MRDFLYRAIPALILAVLAGCGAVRPMAPPPDQPEPPAAAVERRSKATKPTYNLAGYPPAVREGYIDGCESAKETRFARKDARRFDSDAQYAMGWNDGFGICSRK